MIHASVVPDGQVIDITPLMSHLQVVVLDHKLREPVNKVSRFVLAKTIDSLHMMTDREDALPASDGVRADYWMDSFKSVANVLWRAAFLSV